MLHDSVTQNKEGLLNHSKAQLELAESANGATSVFVLDALLTEVSSLVDAQEPEQAVTRVVQRMVQLSEDSNYVTQAQVMLALYMLPRAMSAGSRDESLALVKVLEQAVITMLN